MVVVHIDTIHGDHLVRAPAAEAFDLAGLAPPSRIVATAPGVSEIRLQRFFGSPVWRAETPEGAKLFDARSGAPLPALTESQVRAQARRIYTGEGKIVSVRLLTKAPQEMQSRKPPYWQVEFEGWKDRKSTRLNSSH